MGKSTSFTCHLNKGSRLHRTRTLPNGKRFLKRRRKRDLQRSPSHCSYHQLDLLLSCCPWFQKAHRVDVDYVTRSSNCMRIPERRSGILRRPNSESLPNLARRGKDYECHTASFMGMEQSGCSDIPNTAQDGVTAIGSGICFGYTSSHCFTRLEHVVCYGSTQ